MTTAVKYAELLDDAFGLPEEPEVARGDALFGVGAARRMPSELAGVDDDAWARFVCLMATQPLETVTDRNYLGMFEMTPRRLADLHYVSPRLRRTQLRGKTVWIGAWILPPWNASAFLRSPWLQYRVFVQSMKDYDDQMTAGTIVRDPAMSRAGALGILHRAGPMGLSNWQRSKHPETVTLHSRVEGCF